MEWNRLLRPELIWVVIPVTAIVVWGVITIVGQVHSHRERQAMIEQGIHPDHPRDDPAQGPAANRPGSGNRA